MKQHNTVHILMAAYNGEKYLEQQLASIGRQTIQNWVLHVCDDASSDRTPEILEAFQKRFAGQVFISRNQRNLGAKNNFAKLLTEVKEPEGYYAFCDQDDVWRADKLEKLCKKLQEEEKKKRQPVLVWSDAALIDGHGRKAADSFVGQSGLVLPEKHVFEKLLLYNFVQGASAMWNWELHRLFTEVPEQILMHDWWVALVAAGHGTIVYLPERLLGYRQHDNNVLGGFDRKKWHQSFLGKLNPCSWSRLIQNNHILQEERKAQTQAYIEIYGDERAEAYLHIMKQNRFVRAYKGIRGGYLFMSWKYSVKYYLL